MDYGFVEKRLNYHFSESVLMKIEMSKVDDVHMKFILLSDMFG